MPAVTLSSMISIKIESWELVISLQLGIVLAVIATGFTYWLCKRNKSSFQTEIDSVELQFGAAPKTTIKINRETQRIAFAAYTELATRKVGLPFEKDYDVVFEIYDSWYQMFGITRELIKSIPAHHIANSKDTKNLVSALIYLLNQGLRPHLTRWQAKYRKWYGHELLIEANKLLSPQEIQRKFPDYEELITDLKATNRKLGEFAHKLRELAEGRNIEA
jgi:hypothetical protein